MDLLSRLPGKLIEYPFTQPSAGGITVVAHSAFPGLLAPVLAVLGFKDLDRNKLALIAIGLAAMFFTLGTTVEIGGQLFTSPLVLFYRYVPLSQYLRVELRAYSIVLLCMSLFAAYGWRRIGDLLGRWSSRLSLAGVGVVCTCRTARFRKASSSSVFNVRSSIALIRLVSKLCCRASLEISQVKVNPHILLRRANPWTRGKTIQNVG